ncbi:MAG: prepilin peptidase [Candidatus Eremiobacteraeota bacterium]|nr:prepilin peptidase [Candidatus Eremiobacteraeota bacterium]
MTVRILVGALLFASAAVAGIVGAALLCARLRGFDDGPVPRKPPLVALIAGAALFGGVAVVHASPDRLALSALVAAAFVAIWYCDDARGLVPDPLTLGPLAVLIGVSLLRHDPRALVAALVLFVPFAAAAWLSKGRGMGWGDVKLAALVGAVLGASNGLLACALAAFAAFAGTRFAPILAARPALAAFPALPSDAGLPQSQEIALADAPRPLAFAPYLIGAATLFAIWSAAL